MEFGVFCRCRLQLQRDGTAFGKLTLPGRVRMDSDFMGPAAKSVES